MVGDTGAPGDATMDSTTVDSMVLDSSLPTGDCRITDMLDIHTEPSTAFREATVTVGGGVDGFLIGYSFDTTGRQSFYTRHVPTTGTAVGSEVDASQLTSGAARGGAVMGMGSQWLLAWPDTRLIPPATLRGRNIHTATAGAGGASPSAATNITTEAEVYHDQPTLLLTADGYLLVWTRNGGGAIDVDEGYAVTLDGDGVATGAPAAIAGMSDIAGRVALGALLDGVAAVWVQDADSSGSTRDVRLLVMDRDGTPRGEHTTITTAPNAGSVADYAGAIDGGGVVYEYRVSGTRQEIRYRAVDVDGVPIIAPRSLIPAGEQGRAPAIDILGGNALVAYRGLDRDDVQSIQLVVADGVGNEIARTTVAMIEDWTRGDVHLAFTPAGEGLIVWSDQVAGDYSIHGARIDCSEAP
jgi:hypothetical protein